MVHAYQILDHAVRGQSLPSRWTRRVYYETCYTIWFYSSLRAGCHSVRNGASDCEQYSDSTQGNKNFFRQSDSSGNYYFELGIRPISRRHQKINDNMSLLESTDSLDPMS